MNTPDSGFGQLKINPDWAKLPLFDRTGWRRLPFGAFAESVNERVEPAAAAEEIYVGLEHLDPQDLHIRRWGKGSDVIGTKLRFRKGDLIFGRRRAYQRKLAVAEFDGICSAHAMVVRANPDVVLPEFLPFLMMSDRFMQRAVEISVGSLSPTINWTALKVEEFALPTIEQQRLTAVMLSAVAEVLRANRSNVDTTESLRVAMLFELYRRGIGHSSFVQTALGPRPRAWQVAPLGRHYEVQLGKMMSPNAVRGDSQRPYVRNANVQWNHLDLSDVATMSFNEREVAKFELRVGDILACEGRHVGDLAKRHSRCVLSEGASSTSSAGFRSVPEFLLFQMEHHALSGILADQTGETTIPHLPAERLRDIPFVFPPRSEQLAIADRLETVVSSLQKLRAHTGIVGQLFSTLSDRVFDSPRATA